MPNSKIVKNTLLLYIRMGATMLVGIYSSRIVLLELGVDDYGLYNVVGGIIGLFTFINSALTSSTQRFLNFHMEDEDKLNLNKVFSASFFNHLLIAFVILVVAETLGLWIVNYKLNIPDNSLYAVQWVYQFSIFASILLITQSPYNAVIIANEKMDVYAYISILDVFLKLAIVFLLPILPYNKLITYGFLIFLVQFIINIILRFYCIKEFEESKVKFYKGFKKNLELFKFSMWAFLGGAGYALSFQGVNILLNIFFGPSINAARGIAFTVSNIANQFMRSFQVAVNPQLVKNYAANRKEEMMALLLNNIKYSLFLVWLIILPILFETKFLFDIWLKTPPDYAVTFAKIILFKNLILCFELPFNTVNGATGKNKSFNLVVTICLGLTFPISYLFLKIGYSAYIVFVIDLILYFTIIIFKARILNRQINLTIVSLFKDVIEPFLYVLIISLLPTYLVYHFFEASYMRLLLISITSTIFTLISVYFFGISRQVKLIVNNKTKRYLALIREKLFY
jgi:O-antigen/teichoic acid export membrane protein